MVALVLATWSLAHAATRVPSVRAAAMTAGEAPGEAAGEEPGPADATRPSCGPSNAARTRPLMADGSALAPDSTFCAVGSSSRPSAKRRSIMPAARRAARRAAWSTELPAMAARVPSAPRSAPAYGS